MGREVKHIKVYSKKYNIEGEIMDAGVVTKLTFHYDNKDIILGLSHGLTFHDTYENAGEKAIDFYIEKIQPDTNDKVMLHNWYMNMVDYHNGSFLQLHGVVTGHERLMDSTFIHTSEVLSYEVDYEKGELIAQTRNTLYHCPLNYMNFSKYEKENEDIHLIADYERIKKEYQERMEYPEIEPGNVLLVLSNFDEYYFHSLYCKPREDTNVLKWQGYPHVGMFQDSFLVQTERVPLEREDAVYGIDLRYFPHYQNIEFYTEETVGMPWYIENIGSTTIYCRTSCGQIKLEPHSRKKVCEENTEEENLILPGGDLYPAGFIEG